MKRREAGRPDQNMSVTSASGSRPVMSVVATAKKNTRHGRPSGYTKLPAADPTEQIPVSSASLLPELTPSEATFFQLINSGNVKAVSDFLHVRDSFNINCQNFQGLTALVLAIKSGDVRMLELLLKSEKIILGDSLLHAAESGNCRILAKLLSERKETKRKGGVAKDGQRDFWYGADFSSDLTPLMVAAHCEHYKAIQLLMSEGYTIEKPHPSNCLCPEKCTRRKLGESRRRYNALRALASPSYIAQSSADAVLTAFRLSQELSSAAETEPEFKMEYKTLAKQCDDLAVGLLDQCRTEWEVEMVLHKTADDEAEASGQRSHYARLQMALDLDQKSFVAHANCQKVLAGVWLEGRQQWSGLSFADKCMSIVSRLVLLPLITPVYLIWPNSRCVSSWRAPFNKFLSFAASYFAFLVVFLADNVLDKEGLSGRPVNTGLKWFVVLYVVGFAWRCFTQMWIMGWKKYTRYYWNLYNILMIATFFFAFVTLAWSALEGRATSSLPRMYWDQYDPTLISEALYSVAVIIAFGKTMYFLQIGCRLGPLQVSMIRMGTDILTCLLLFLVMMTSFAVGMHKLYYHYKGQIRGVGDLQVRQSDAFNTFLESLETLYWAIYRFGYSPHNLADIVISEHVEHVGNATRLVGNHHGFTETVGHVMFACYHIISIITSVSMLIAMMSESFAKVQANADMEWKFIRTKVWMSFIVDCPGPLPPPFNLIPSPTSTGWICQWIARAFCGRKGKKCGRLINCCLHFEDDRQPNQEQKEYRLLMHRLLQRYLATNDRMQRNILLT